MKKKVVREYQPKLKVLEVNFADMKIGQKMAIGTPEMILELTKMIPKGERWTMKVYLIQKCFRMRPQMRDSRWAKSMLCSMFI